MSSPLFEIHENTDLQSLHSFNCALKTKFFCCVKSKLALEQLAQHTIWQKHNKLFLGSGTNMLFTQNYPGFIIKICIPGIKVLKADEYHVWLRVGAGVLWDDLVKYCVENGYAGIENLSLIPGQVGAAPIQNIGAYGVELQNCFESLEAYHIHDKCWQHFSRTQCKFGYRDSIFKHSHKNQFVIANITLRLYKKPRYFIDYPSLAEALSKQKSQNLSLQLLRHTVCQIRRSKLPDPQQIANAGSFFKNPIINTSEYVNLSQQYPQLPHYPLNETKVKLSAAWLIESCNWKGKRIGNIGVHAKQALVLVNYGNGLGADIYELAQEIQHSVKNKFGVKLVPEVNIY